MIGFTICIIQYDQYNTIVYYTNNNILMQYANWF